MVTDLPFTAEASEASGLSANSAFWFVLIFCLFLRWQASEPRYSSSAPSEVPAAGHLDGHTRHVSGLVIAQVAYRAGPLTQPAEPPGRHLAQRREGVAVLEDPRTDDVSSHSVPGVHLGE